MRFSLTHLALAIGVVVLSPHSSSVAEDRPAFWQSGRGMAALTAHCQPFVPRKGLPFFLVKEFIGKKHVVQIMCNDVPSLFHSCQTEAFLRTMVDSSSGDLPLSPPTLEASDTLSRIWRFSLPADQTTTLTIFGDCKSIGR